MNPLVALICLGFFIIIVAITKYVSLGSILGIGLSLIIMLINHNTEGILVTLFLTISVAITHKENIKRLLNGTERKIGQKKN
ncbi:Glycerol-3-phosphate acyltransferase [bioreactor metagenome]|uniref:Glycerol-3-phosphate acyltransferase n=2 Tax=root TaxID=1 RepID=A0A645I3C0_9ZZZZ